MKVPAPKPGVYKGQSKAYYNWDAVNNTSLGHLKESAERFQWLQTHQEPETEAMLFGRKLHSVVFDGADIEAVCPPSGKNGNLLKSDVDERAKLAGMSAALKAHPLVSNMILKTSPEHRELAIVWDDAETGVRCKALLDSVFPYRNLAGLTKFCVWDLKSTVDASQAEFQKSFYKYGYHRQCAQYWEAALSVPLDVETFVFVAIEKTEPYPIVCYEVDQEARLAGKWERYKLLRRYQECMASGQWPGYADPTQFHKLNLPAWAKKEIELL